MRITPGKQKGMKAVSDSRGVIAAAAMDQRGSLKSAIAKERGVDKKAVTAADDRGIQDRRHARPHAARQRHPARSRIRPARRASARSSNAGLLLAYENSGYDNTHPGRLPDLLDIWSVRRLVGCRRRLHQDSALLHALRFRTRSTTSSTPGSNASARNASPLDVPFFLEFVGYEEGGDEKSNRVRAQEARDRHQEHGRILEAAIRRGRPESRSSRQHGLRRRRAKPARANPPTRATKPRNIFAAPPPSPKSRSSIFPPASATMSSTNRSNWPPKPAPISPASSAAAPPGKKASRSTPSKASRPSKTGSTTRA